MVSICLRLKDSHPFSGTRVTTRKLKAILSVTSTPEPKHQAKMPVTRP